MTVTASQFPVSDLLEGIRTWVEIESPSRDRQAANRMADRIEADYRAAGAVIDRYPGTGGLGDPLLAASARTEGPGVLILSHYDTVHPSGTLRDRLPFRIEGDLAWGPGIADMKAGAYLAFAALSALIRGGTEPALPIRHLIVPDEEIGSPSSRVLIEREARRAAYVLVTEPVRDGGRCVTARKGIAAFTLRVRGHATHAGLQHREGRSAIREMARHILDLEAMTDYDLGLTVNVGTVRGGTQRNVVPDEAVAEIDMRLPNPGIGEWAIAKVMALQAQGPGLSLSVAGGLNRPPYVKTPGIAALHGVARRIAGDLGFDLPDCATSGGSDANFASPFAPVLDGLGADGQDSSHTTDERIRIPCLPQRAALLGRLMAESGTIAARLRDGSGES